jgi:hypothetical protein
MGLLVSCFQLATCVLINDVSQRLITIANKVLDFRRPYLLILGAGPPDLAHRPTEGLPEVPVDRGLGGSARSGDLRRAENTNRYYAAIAVYPKEHMCQGIYYIL